MRDTLTALVIIIVIMAGIYALSYPVRLFFTNQDTQITRHSNEYVTTKQNELNLLLTNYEAAETDRQRAAIRIQMRAITSTLEPNQVPAQIAEILK